MSKKSKSKPAGDQSRNQPSVNEYEIRNALYYPQDSINLPLIMNGPSRQ